MKIKVGLSIGYPTAKHEDVIEVPDDATDEECEEACIEWSYNFVNTYWEKV